MVAVRFRQFRDDVKEIIGPDKFRELVKQPAPIVAESAALEQKSPLEWATDNKETHDREFGDNAPFIMATAIQLAINLENA